MKELNKYQGKKSEFVPVREDASRVIICYGFEAIDEENGTWYEIHFYKKQVSQLSLDDARKAIIADIDERTDEKILNGYPFTPDGEDGPVIVWLSKESQTNFSEAHRLKMVPVKFKLNEDTEGNPIYHTFETFEELDRFYKGGVLWINQCLNEGWAEKDSVDWGLYEHVFAGSAATAEPSLTKGEDGL